MIKAIYKITNLINGKIYIGQSQHPKRRWVEHCSHAMNETDNYPIHLAIKKYGKDNFQMDILEWTENYDEREKELIKLYNCLSPNGYNLVLGGHNPIMTGEQNPRNKVKNTDLEKIIQDLKENLLTDRQIAKKYNLSDKIIADINHGYSHKIENEQYPLRVRRGRQKLTKQQVAEIKRLLKETMLSYQQIANQFNITKGNIYQINRGGSFKQEDETYPIRTKENVNVN